MKTEKLPIISSLLQVENRLGGNFNLNINIDREQLKDVIELKKKLEDRISGIINEVIEKQEITRSTNALCSVKSPSLNIRSLDLIADKIYTKSYSYLTSGKLSCLCYFRFGENDIELISTLEKFPSQSILRNRRFGEFFEFEMPDKVKLYTIFGKEEVDDDNLVNWVKGVDTVITQILENNYNNIGVLCNFDLYSHSISANKILLNIISLLFLLKMQKLPADKQIPAINFIFESENDRRLIDDIMLNYRRNYCSGLIKTNNLENKLKLICEKCKTQDHKYIQTLESMLYILDESRVSILLLGESGVGKSFLAKAIHEVSNRTSSPFEQLNCGILSGEKMYQQIWGWEKGSFTGANSNYDGLLTRVDKGTLFLDEIDRASIEVRNSLLTFIENKTYQSLGGIVRKIADIRFIFGSNKNLTKLIRKGLFEDDFYSRISNCKITIPPLRERLDDIDFLVEHFIKELNTQKKSNIIVDKQTMQSLKSYNWPMNIRELQQYISSLFYKAHYHGDSIISFRYIEEAPFENLFPSRIDELNDLIELLRAFILDWKSDNGNILEEIILPILAKIYKDDYSTRFSKEQAWKLANDIVGISGLNHNSSSLMKYYNKFDDIIKKIEKEK